MSSTIVLYFALLILGGFLSYKGLVGQKLFEKITHLQMGCLYGLIFIMGIRLGMNQEVMSSISTIGVKSLGFALATIIGSMAVVFFISKFIIKSKALTGRSNHENNH